MNVTVTDSIVIAATPDVVWDATQDWTRRSTWDPSVLAAEVLPGDPPRVRVKGPGGSGGVLQYKLFDRPRRTSVALVESDSRLIKGAGGSWEYAAVEGGTRLTQTNTLKLGLGLLGRLAAPFVRRRLASATRAALEGARRMVEGAAAGAKR